jgi:asparagine synthase (glutamine-hydrolysing)
LTLANAGDSRVRAYCVSRAPLPASDVGRLLGRRLTVAFADVIVTNALPSEGDEFQIASSLESGLYMSNQLLRDMDNFSMSNSIELRAPFLDHELADYVYCLPKALKLAGTGPKPLLTSSLEFPLGDAVTQGKKRGFSFPLEEWIRTHLTEDITESLSDPSLSRWLNVPAVQTLWQQYLAGRLHWSVVWNLYALVRWLNLNEK